MADLFARLKQRKLVQWTIAYAAFAFAVIQVLDAVADSYSWPHVVMHIAFGVLALGFVVMLVLAWYHGERGIQRLGGGELLIIALLLAIGGGLIWRFGSAAQPSRPGLLAQAQSTRSPSASTAAPNPARARLRAPARATARPIPAKSVAVLPFANHDPKQRYFSDGMAEELISDLTQVNGLKVIGKYSSFKFRSSKESPAVIGAALGVANLVEGSVRQSGKHIRIVVNLIRAKDGTSVWSHSYDQPLKDVFAIQSRIGHAVAKALRVKLLGDAVVSDDKPPSGNIQAYQLMLQARAITEQYSATAFRRSTALVKQALKLDPNYAYAWGLLSNVQMNLGTYYLHSEARQQAFTTARQAADKQAVLAPDATSTYITRGRVLSNLDNDPRGALAEFRRALTQAPNDGGVMASLAGQYGTLGRLRPAIKLYRKAIATDPLESVTYVNLSIVLAASGQMEQAEQAIRQAVALQPESPIVVAENTVIDILRGDAAAALRDAAKEHNPEFKALLLVLARQIAGNAHAADTSLRAYIAKYGDTQPYYVADVYALRKQPDKMFAWLQRARAANDPILSSLLTDALVLRYKADPRFAGLCHELGLPAPGEPRPAASAGTSP